MKILKNLVIFLVFFTLIFLPHPSYAAWWNTSWTKCKNITMYFSATKNFYPTINNQMAGINITGLSFTSLNEIRIVNAPCNAGGVDIPFDILSNTTSSVEVLFLANGTAVNTPLILCITAILQRQHRHIQTPSRHHQLG